MYRLIFSDLSEQQISEALVYYNDISISLGQKFEENLVNAFQSLKQHPYHYFNLNKKHRRITIKDFPYQLIYTIIELTKKSLSQSFLFHLQTNPKRIKRL